MNCTAAMPTSLLQENTQTPRSVAAFSSSSRAKFNPWSNPYLILQLPEQNTNLPNFILFPLVMHITFCPTHQVERLISSEAAREHRVRARPCNNTPATTPPQQHPCNNTSAKPSLSHRLSPFKPSPQVRAAGRYLQSFESAFSADGVKTIMRLFPGTDASATAAALTPHTILEACQRACATISRLEAAVAALKADADAAVAGFDKAVAEHHAVTAHRLRQQLHELQSQVHVTTTEVMQKQQRMHDEALEAQVLLQCCSIIKKM